MCITQTRTQRDRERNEKKEPDEGYAVLSARGYLCVKLSFFQSSESLGIEIGSRWSIFFSHFAKILRLGVILANYWTFSYWSAVSISGIIGHVLWCLICQFLVF